jgi:hypothetical protein
MSDDLAAVYGPLLAALDTPPPYPGAPVFRVDLPTGEHLAVLPSRSERADFDVEMRDGQRWASVPVTRALLDTPLGFAYAVQWCRDSMARLRPP